MTSRIQFFSAGDAVPQLGTVVKIANILDVSLDELAGPLIEAGNIFLPHPLYAAWVNDFIEECAAFPNGAHDDQVDAMTQALLRWHMVPEQVVIEYSQPYMISPI